MFNKVQQLYTKFGLENNNGPTTLSKEEYIFRIGAMFEELMEYVSTVFQTDLDPDKYAAEFKQMLQQYQLCTEPNLKEELDALVDLSVFAMGTAERQGFKFTEAFERVMKANLNKELSTLDNKSKRDFAVDLIKPAGWQAPNFDGIMDNKPTGIIILEGPDGCGKTTLANHFIEKYDAKYMHLTWSEDLEKCMDKYQIESLLNAEQLSKDHLVIIDRLWISEIVYSDVYREGSQYRGLHQTMKLLIDKMDAINIVCLPEGEQDYYLHFQKLKDEREEMYTNPVKALEVYGVYSALWFGVEHGSYKTPTCKAIMEAGGLEIFDNYYRYDFMQEGMALGVVCDFYINKLREAKNEK